MSLFAKIKRRKPGQRPKPKAKVHKPAKPKPQLPVGVNAAVHRKNIASLIQQLSHNRRDRSRAFSDVIACTALAISNRVDLHHYEAREKQYMEIVGQYERDEVMLFPQLYGELQWALQAEVHDAIGKVFAELELQNKWAGQFFTPYELCYLLGSMQVDDRMKELIKQQGYITVSEPACGAGGCVIGLAHAMADAGINYQQSMHVTAIDIDIRCVHMAYVQLSLLGIPAVVVHGNTLSAEMWNQWYTPMHIMGGWQHRLRNKAA